ncbi:MAG: glucose-6-phosphate isomerase, partial [Epulopiscium sp.]|nr:glucose-6-phosphate isomerase [Candidatus Epulonipiscium sp.]
MGKILFDYSNAGIRDEEIKNALWQLKDAHNMLHNKTGAGNDFLGWIDLPVNYDKEEFNRVKAAAKRIRENSDVF